MTTLRLGRSLQFTGITLALVSIVLGLLPPGTPDVRRAQLINCANNLKQIGLSFKTWAIDNNDQFPFNVGTNRGGTHELCLLGDDGFDKNAYLHFQVMSNELSTPLLLVCPKDSSRKRARDFSSLKPENVSYLLHSGTNFTDANPHASLVVCPVHSNILHCDGEVTVVKTDYNWSDTLSDLVNSATPELLLSLIGVVLGILIFRLGIKIKRQPS